jgi:hypothetical protein
VPATIDPYIQQLIQTHNIDANNPFRDPAWRAIAAEANQVSEHSLTLAAWFTNGRPEDPYSRSLAKAHRIDTTGDASSATGWTRLAADAEFRDLRSRLGTAALWAQAHLPADHPARRAA